MERTDFILRKWGFEDLETLVKYANNPNISKYTSDGFPYPYTQKDGENYLNMVLANDKPIGEWLAIDVKGEAIGSVGLIYKNDIYRLNMEIGYWLAEPFWGRGIMTNAIKQSVREGFKKYPNVQRIYGSTFGTNIGSQKAMLKAGFTQEARIPNALIKNANIEDEVIFGIRREMIG